MSRTVLALIPDAAEARSAQDIGALRRWGLTVRVAAFERGGGGAPDVSLGALPMGAGPRRVLSLVRALRHVARLRRLMAQADIVLARNLDMSVLALATAATLRRPPPLVYQCLDIHDLLSRRGIAGAMARWLERRVLGRTARLVISAPAFLPHHFARHHIRLPEVLLRENRVVTSAPRPAPRRSQGALRLGWVGSLRCAPSLDLLTATARAAPGIRLSCHGAVHEHAVPDFADRLALLPNAAWHGPYGPQDLPAIYDRLDAVWAQDLWQRGGNSDWLLPNRLYEAGFFGCPVIAVAGTETAAWITRHGTGWVIDAPTPEALRALIDRLDPAALLARRRHILGLHASLFASDGADAVAMIAPVHLPGPRHVPAPASA